MSRRRFKKELGQHFLTRPEVCAPLVEFLRPRDRLVVEVGPGAGALTGVLLRAGARVVAWELDPRWAFDVDRRFAQTRLATVVGDAAELPWHRLALGTLVAGNLPYNVATRIILEMLESTLGAGHRILRAGFLVQHEVAGRLVARPGGKAYGSLSVLVAALADVRRLGVVAPGAFRPTPKVDSAFVGLTPRLSALDASHYARLKVLVRAAFAQRRKTLRNSLASTFGAQRVEALMTSAGLDRSCRAETLAAEDFTALLEHWDRLESTGSEGPFRTVE